MLHVSLYRFAPKSTAFRNDYCRPCADERISVRVRTFNMLAVMLIPLIPLGFQHRWICTTCGLPTRQSTRTRPGFKIAGAIVLALMTLILWAVPTSEFPADEQLWIWGLRIVLPVLFLWTLHHLRTAAREPDYDEAFSRVQPYTSWQCPFCQVDLVSVPTWHCPNCGLERM